ncbi:MAG: helicase-related protein, partial [Microcoleus sp.]
IEPAQFPAPNPSTIQDHIAAQLLLNATRLSLRSGAGPFRCLGRLSVRPRPYQLVPLLMALRLSVVRLLVADDVGIGKTIEAGLIARELLDRGEVKRLAVLCPPQLCDQWQRELKQKFHINAAVIRSGTASKLERALPTGDSHIFSYYQHIIVSLDYVKSDRRRAVFLTHCPDLVIVDEAHTCTNSQQQKATAQQRYELVKALAEKASRHLLLLTATPHSGIEAAFMSLLGLLNPKFEQFNLETIAEKERIELASHFIQRRRVDVRQWLDSETPFPQRESLESAYQLSADYRHLFDRVFDFARGLVLSVDDSLSYAQKRGRYWSALAIIRCVMSSPAAAISTLSRQVRSRESELATQELDELWDDELAASYVSDPTETEQVADASPTAFVAAVVDAGQTALKDSQKRKLRDFVKQAEALKGAKDVKLQKAIALVKELLQAGLNPIVWCRYIATANYVAEALRTELENKKNSDIRVIAISGEDSEDKREIRLAELIAYPQRVLVATDCLSEGLNLQEHFTAAIHYDLPWNPNRLEQREGRIDRYGQTAPTVKCILLYGQDNPVDGAVLEVLIRKAVAIHKTLGVTVPVPVESAAVQEAVFKSLFENSNSTSEYYQLSLFDILQDENSPITEVHQQWDRAAAKEKLNRTRFAQRSIKPADVKRELIESDSILGSAADVEHFVKSACDRLNASLVKKKNGWHLPNIPPCLVPLIGNKPRTITFDSPAPTGIEYIGRNHAIVEGLAQYLLEGSLDDLREPAASRCGFTVAKAVSQPTVILLLRLRHLLESSRSREGGVTLLAEECLVRGFRGNPAQPQWLSEEEILRLWEEVEPTGDLPIERKKLALERLLSRLGDLEANLTEIARERADVLSESHRRVRAITKEGQVKVIPQLPMDILGIYILQPP